MRVLSILEELYIVFLKGADVIEKARNRTQFRAFSYELFDEWNVKPIEDDKLIDKLEFDYYFLFTSCLFIYFGLITKI